jgi:RPA family protein
MTGREPAWRVFANELQASLFDEKGAGERATSYLLSPLGARMNRVLLIGTLAAPESLGADESKPFLRSEFTDPTGAVTVTAGSFQPRALTAMRSVSGSGAYLLVGKAHLFIGRNGTAHPSVRAEALRPIGPDEVRAGWAEAADQTLLRIEIMEAIRVGRRGPGDGTTPSSWSDSARAAQARYPSADPGSFRGGLEMVLRALGPATAAPVPLVQPPTPRPPMAPVLPPRVHVTHAPPVPAAPGPVTAAARAQESAFLDIVDELADVSADGYADLREALGLAGRRGVPADEAERLLNRLEEEGVLEEPVVGKVRRS